MLSLLKIRYKYFLRKKGILLWTYFSIPLIILILFICGLIINKGVFIKSNSLKIYFTRSILINMNNLFFNNSDYYYDKYTFNKIKSALKATTFLVNNIEDQQLIPKFIYNETDIRVNCYLKESDIKKSYKNLIILNNKDHKYRFNLIQNDTNDYLSNSNYPYEYSQKLFVLKKRDYEKSTDIFHIFDYNGDDMNHNYEIFLEIQSLLSKYLILKEKKMKPNKNLNIYLGKNSFPDFNNYKEIYNYEDLSSICYSIIISFLFSIFNYFFNLEMIDEKEKQLAIFLERKGASKIKYFFSWFIPYLYIMLIPFIIVLIIS